MQKEIWEVIEPQYSIGLLSHEARWWYFEGYFWGGYTEREEAELREAQLRRTVAEMSATIQALRAQTSVLRDTFTWAGPNA